MQRNYRFKPRFVAGYGAAAPPAPAPVLTSPFALPYGDTTGYIGVITDTANGTLYYVVTTSATPPSKSQVKAGQDHTGAAAAASGNQAIASTGSKNATPTGLTSNTLYYPYWMHENSTAVQSDVKGLTSFTTLTTGTSDVSWDNLVAAMTTPPTTFRGGLIARMIQSLYASGTWAKTDVMWVLAAHDEQAARLNWITPASFTLTAVNSPTFTTDRGFTGIPASSAYLDTGWDRATNGAQFTRDDAHISVYQRTNSGGVESFSDVAAGYRIAVGGRPISTTAGGTLVNSSTRVNGPASGSVPLQAIGRRNNSTQASLVRDGVQVTAPTSSNSAALNTSDLAFLRGGTTYVADQLAGGSLGAYLDDTEALAFYNAWYAYMVALGADT